MKCNVVFYDQGTNFAGNVKFLSSYFDNPVPQNFVCARRIEFPAKRREKYSYRFSHLDCSFRVRCEGEGLPVFRIDRFGVAPCARAAHLGCDFGASIYRMNIYGWCARTDDAPFLIVGLVFGLLAFNCHLFPLSFTTA